MTANRTPGHLMPDRAGARSVEKGRNTAKVLAFVSGLLWAVWAVTLSAQTASESLQRTGFDVNPLYIYNYPSLGADGQEVILSSALVVWQPETPAPGDAIESVIVGCHITITSNFEAPTSMKDTLVLGDAYMTAIVPGRSSYQPLSRSLVIMPDYEGYGLSRGRTHPYLARDLTARQVVDAVRYGLMLYQKLVDAGLHLPLADDWKTYCLGYSQGAAVALATQRYIETSALDGELHLAGSICGDGPYDLLCTLRYYMEDNGLSSGVETDHRRGQTNLPAALALIVKGMICSHPAMQSYSADDYLSKIFLDTGIMTWLDDKAGPNSRQKTSVEITRLFYQQAEQGLTASDATVYTAGQMQELFTYHKRRFSLRGYLYDVRADMGQLLQPAIYEYFSSPGRFDQEPPRQPCNAAEALHRALWDNSFRDEWTPRHRIVLLHSLYDTSISYENSRLLADGPAGELVWLQAYGGQDHIDTGSAFFQNLPGLLGRYMEWIAAGLPTALQPVVDDTAQGPWYDLDGRLLPGPPEREGVYLLRGRKVLLKKH